MSGFIVNKPDASIRFLSLYRLWCHKIWAADNPVNTKHLYNI